MNTTLLHEALQLALKLSPKERMRLIEEVASSVEREIEAPSSDVAQPEEHWGKALNLLMEEIGPIEMKYPEIEDPVEWVKQIRRDEREQRVGDWGE